MTEASEYLPMLDAYHFEMVREMQANEHKSTWKGLTPEWALADIHYHVSKLDWAMRHTDERGWDEVREFAADVGNLCAMLLDIAGLFTLRQPATNGFIERVRAEMGQ